MTWRQADSQPLAGKWLTKWLTQFGQSGVFGGAGSDAVAAALDELLGEGWTGQAGGWGRPTVTFPGGDWKIRDQLSQQDPWLREIWHPAGREDRTAALMDDGAQVADVRLRVTELIGAPGDVVLWHPALFHTAASNTASHSPMAKRFREK